MNITLYDKNNIDELNCPDKNDNIGLQKYLEQFIKNGTLNLIDNVDAEMQILMVNDDLFPIILSNPNQKVKNSYVCSPVSHYIDYGKEEIELELKDKPFLKNLSLGGIRAIENFFKKLDFEKVVYVNNFLLSTNLYVPFDIDYLKEIRDFLVKKFPDRPIIFRSINDMYNKNIYDKLSSLGFHHVFSRQVYILDPKKEVYKKKESYQKDLKIKRKTKYKWFTENDITPKDYKRIRELYDFLYIDKYSPLNPTFNEEFINQTINNPLFTYKVLKKDNEIYAVFGYIQRDGVITAPVFGYDTAMPQKDGLYRLTALQILEDALEKNYIVHMSSGVSKFKMHRGAEPSMEYNMVYVDHITKKQRLPWLALEKMTDNIIVPIMRKYQL
ncbi:MAG: hypothetical protein U0457_21880 [Candidatus Sericytochromatia bacterium]